MIGSGRRDTLIAFERSSVIENSYGDETDEWAEIGKEWAAVNWGRGDERRQAALERAEQSATFTVLDNNLTRTLTPADRIHLDGAWDITSTVPGKKRGERDITAIRSA